MSKPYKSYCTSGTYLPLSKTLCYMYVCVNNHKPTLLFLPGSLGSSQVPGPSKNPNPNLNPKWTPKLTLTPNTNTNPKPNWNYTETQIHDAKKIPGPYPTWSKVCHPHPSGVGHPHPMLRLHVHDQIQWFDKLQCNTDLGTERVKWLQIEAKTSVMGVSTHFV